MLLKKNIQPVLDRHKLNVRFLWVSIITWVYTPNAWGDTPLVQSKRATQMIALTHKFYNSQLFWGVAG